eukprot:scaffold768_cov166-Amphora_coffeaeformis.AAC.17
MPKSYILILTGEYTGSRRGSTKGMVIYEMRSHRRVSGRTLGMGCNTIAKRDNNVPCYTYKRVDTNLLHRRKTTD